MSEETRQKRLEWKREYNRRNREMLNAKSRESYQVNKAEISDRRRIENMPKGEQEAQRVAVRRLPTPTTQDASNNGAPSQMLRNTKPLNAEVGGPLNPSWVEWLMGWPIGWTDFTESATDNFRLWCLSHGISCNPHGSEKLNDQVLP